MSNIGVRFFRDDDRGEDMIETSNAADKSSSIRRVSDEDKTAHANEWQAFENQDPEKRKDRMREMDPSLPQFEKEREDKSERPASETAADPVGTYETQPTGTTTEGPAGSGHDGDGIKSLSSGQTVHEGNKGPGHKKKGK